MKNPNIGIMEKYPMLFDKYSKKVLKYKAPSNYILRPFDKMKELNKMEKLMNVLIDNKIKNDDSEHVLMYIVTIINSEKNHLDCDESRRDNKIEEIYKKYCN